MHLPNYLYSLRHDVHLTELCHLECRQLFGRDVQEKVFLSDVHLDPSISPFLKNRLEIIAEAADYDLLLNKIEQLAIRMEGFKVEYLTLDGDTMGFTESRNVLKDIGYRIEGFPNFDRPTVLYSICKHQGKWYFGILAKHDATWYRHKTKPYSFSNSLSMDVAKSLVCIASKGDKTQRLLDACCGVGTVMLEACCSGFNMDGCDINESAYENTLKNLEHYHYKAQVYHCDVKQLTQPYDAAIVDLPYNLYTYSNDTIISSIIDAVAKLCKRAVFVSISDIEPFISSSGFSITDTCRVEKKGKSKFERKIWVCKK